MGCSQSSQVRRKERERRNGGDEELFVPLDSEYDPVAGGLDSRLILDISFLTLHFPLLHLSLSLSLSLSLCVIFTDAGWAE